MYTRYCPGPVPPPPGAGGVHYPGPVHTTRSSRSNRARYRARSSRSNRARFRLSPPSARINPGPIPSFFSIYYARAKNRAVPLLYLLRAREENNLDSTTRGENNLDSTIRGRSVTGPVHHPQEVSNRARSPPAG